MKKNLIVVAVAASFASVAHAQSSVTLYGLLDAGLTYTSNVAPANGVGHGNAKWAAGNGGINQSMFGLRGSEDLGGGLKAIFTLESGFNIGNGKFANNNGMFNRQAFVGLSSAQFGTVTLGRQYDAAQDYLAPLTATGSWGGTYFAHPFNNDNLSTNGGYAVNNSIKYSSANYAGFTFGGTYGFSNQAGAFANNREYSVGAAYQWQGLRLGAAYAQQNNPGATNAAGASNGGASDGSILGLAGNFRQREFGAAGSYSFGPATVGLAWTQSREDNAIGGKSLSANNYEVNGKYNVTPALGLGVAYTFTDAKGYGAAVDGGTPSVRFHQIGLQADYSLSRRTDVYAQAVYQHAMGDGGVASIYSGDNMQMPSSSKNQTAATVGLRHRF
ncbi:Outer membrane porin protein [Paraburkholderia domus]|jgi:Outer membrane protein (porin)|uniref:Outer membrane porin protein n=1 Tax=Paraburkholderia domus TaxID=2793075 RepID=A0A9N8MTT9_9BURK|nr:porin [Paraburkholderia domus]MBK5051208.1 porin [Burkholderia sp. R-70006]MBK5061180.1 porin [Burkholderia sp. R-70199]MBK5090734.1 porin [Burkholderia sp. R-69927]MBK5121092.1 porin [Burkholderia sp. R-69980]MBK5166376.1 porin [Burkholderia sp. R-70211]MBK5184969.1 porin [Burkholderia sp. R-69749]MCI0146529.1 porin [Paraburkholderia sediminicola]